MGNSKSKKVQKEPDKFFDRERWKEQNLEEKKKKNANPANKRTAVKDTPLKPGAPADPPGPGPIPVAAQVRSYDSDALDRMRHQLNNDSDAFLLNNILLCVQFFENYEREAQYIKRNPISERDHSINEAMVRRHKHVFFADRLQECVHDHVQYQRRRDQPESLISPRMFVVYDNVEASEPGDTSDYSAVLDAPFYKLRIEESKETGYVSLKKLEVLKSTFAECESEERNLEKRNSDDSIYTESEKESIESVDSDDSPYASKGEALLHKIKTKIEETNRIDNMPKSNYIKLNPKTVDPMGRRFSGPVKQLKSQIAKSNISNIHSMRKVNVQVIEENENVEQDAKNRFEEDLPKPRKSILKMAKQSNVIKVSMENTVAEDTETSGYRSNSSSRHNESSETESDYGYSTITESTTPKRIELSDEYNYSQSSGCLPEECWTQVETRTVDHWSDEDEEDDTASNVSVSRNLYETHHNLSSTGFMKNFVDNFIINLGSALGLSQETINNAPSQGATIYCNSTKNGFKIIYEVLPALIASWPNAANQWIIRERKIIQNPRTNCSYQWPTRYMVNKAVGFGCLLVPLGFRPKRGMNPEQEMQWKIIFPAAERYLESCLAHSHIRCYLFALLLQKTFMENETSKIGIDSNHLKNHLFWECENNYARWPEDRLGETLRLFLKSFYVHFGQSRFPNYFVQNCNDFKSIPKPLLLKLQRKLADILEAPVMHVLHALSKLKYAKNDFYPAFNAYRLYDILTCKNPLRILNPNLPAVLSHNNQSSDSEDDSNLNFWDKAKAHDKHYQWKKERQRQIKERRKNQMNNKKQKASVKQEREINKNIILPARMENERRRVVLEFFIPHFIAMARSSEKYEAIKQAVIYLEQAQRLCILLLEVPSGDSSANDYLYVIRDKLADCQRKLVNQEGFNLPPRESHSERVLHPSRLRKHRQRYEHVVSQDSPTDASGILPFTFVDIHDDSHSNNKQDKTKLQFNDSDGDEDSKL